MKKLESYEKTLSSTTDLIYGAFKNESSPSAKDGTDIVAEHMQDLYYPLYQVLQLAGIQPNGSLENCSNTKQFLNSLANIAPLIYDSSLTYAKNTIVINVFNNEINIYQSKKADNKSVLNDTSSWNLLAKINDSGVFSNITLNSPVLTGIPTAPTAAAGTSTNQLATTEFVTSQIIANFLNSFYSNIEIDGTNFCLEFYTDNKKQNRVFMIQIGKSTGFSTVSYKKQFKAVFGVFAQVITSETCVSAAISNVNVSNFYLTDGTHGGKHEDRYGLSNYWIAFGT